MSFGQIRQSSDIAAFSGRLLINPEKCAHFAGDSKTVGYSVGFISTIFRPSVTMSSLGMQCGWA